MKPALAASFFLATILVPSSVVAQSTAEAKLNDSAVTSGPRSTVIQFCVAVVDGDSHAASQFVLRPSKTQELIESYVDLAASTRRFHKLSRERFGDHKLYMPPQAFQGLLGKVKTAEEKADGDEAIVTFNGGTLTLKRLISLHSKSARPIPTARVWISRSALEIPLRCFGRNDEWHVDSS